mmetsp:Transcript_37729/g.126225  ORF Transcript_37729/g.126225 Transcript_37729/m.126225 type:complete len:202 (-) Transcript_37729:317-922(-)
MCRPQASAVHWTRLVHADCPRSSEMTVKLPTAWVPNAAARRAATAPFASSPPPGGKTRCSRPGASRWSPSVPMSSGGRGSGNRASRGSYSTDISSGQSTSKKSRPRPRHSPAVTEALASRGRCPRCKRAAMHAGLAFQTLGQYFSLRSSTKRLRTAACASLPKLSQLCRFCSVRAAIAGTGLAGSSYGSLSNESHSYAQRA